MEQPDPRDVAAARQYIASIHNVGKRKYAEQYLQALLDGQRHPEIADTGCGSMARQAVRLALGSLSSFQS